MQRHFNTISSVFILIGSINASADSGVDSLRLAYDFNASIESINIKLENADSLQRAVLENELLLSDNGRNMMSYCSRPTVVEKKTFSLKDYHLYFPLENNSWRPLPNVLDSSSNNKFVRALYAPADAREIYYSAEDSDGIRNIYRTDFKDSLWSLPKLINEHITSCSNEITPFVSKDGKFLYFASEGLYGMGGYDIYVSQWDEKTGDWGIPSNMGFPYSSPYDDFFYMTDEDGQHAFFASNRNCGRDSVTIYVVEYDPMPVRVAVSDVGELRELCSMKMESPVSSKEDENLYPKDESTRMYIEKMGLVRSLTDSLEEENRILEKLRAKLSLEGDDDNGSITKRILAGELALPSLQERLKEASASLQKIELDFLMKGINLSNEEMDANHGFEGSRKGYAFEKRSPGTELSINLEVPEIKFDYSFMILDEARFAEDNTLPQGLVYQIKLFTLSRRVGVKEFKGLSPVFEQNPSKGKFIYSVGLFHSYNDALSKLNKVKKLGFKDAILSAYNSGKPISVSSARSLEKTIKTYYRIKIYPDNGESLPEPAINAIHTVTESDIVKGLDGAAIVFELGPFDSKEKVEQIKKVLLSFNITNINVYVDNSFPDSTGHSFNAH